MTKAILAVDKNIDEIAKIKNKKINLVKVGLSFLTSQGITGVKNLKKKFPNLDLFLDLKLLDTPDTIEKAVKNLSTRCDLTMLTIHLSGGEEMVRKAVQANSSPNLTIVGVTVLTSLKTHLKDVMSLVDLAHESGIKAVVCSVHEVKEIKKKYPDMQTIVPGIRKDGNNNHDQKRTATPQEARDAGADYMIIGRDVDNLLGELD